ncbi:hypothetical protein MuYL_4457 [Mucilaginibacter xinganensis]|uniref:HTH cro/C1-type domain-containing protein n=2 Tax=Mucilaginibacter xinganensis TaxID=1234841 RepID=A0A223P2M8_9SPHI|nr:hypothetical protein MuYL_4457 [Mucilaginibacter xinganensis]
MSPPDSANIHHCMVVRSILPYRKVVRKPPRVLFPKSLDTLGDHVRTARLQRGLLQRDVAKIVNVSEDSVTYWENGRAIPQIQHYPLIIAFLGYYPFTHETDSIAGKLKQLRFCLGYSYEQCGEVFVVNASTIRAWELCHNLPSKSKQSLIQARWRSLPDFLTKKTT